mmetsp:Transcript_11960/g.20944  ORF Transcript_11960/g.20944 Transcript_11960/m.20944 type:complete len:86 (-) Transcript_11960:35-292(-)
MKRQLQAVAQCFREIMTALSPPPLIAPRDLTDDLTSSDIGQAATAAAAVGLESKAATPPPTRRNRRNQAPWRLIKKELNYCKIGL